MNTQSEPRVLLGVSGSIAAYKAPQIARELIRGGAEVRAVMTRSATQFVGPLALQAVTGTAVGVDLFDPVYEEQIGHIELARWADVVLLAPATANLIGKVANGLADDLLSTIVLATTAPLVVAPAMNTQMLRHPMVRANLDRIESLLGAVVIPPDEGVLACEEVGAGRLPDPPALIDGVRNALAPKLLAGKRVLVTTGPTRERLDAVRYFTNPSSGRMGFAMASAARHLGAEVIVVAGPTSAPVPPGITLRRVESAAEMAEAVDQVLGTGVDVAVFAAAVADLTPGKCSEQKVPKGDLPVSLSFERTRDILADITARSERPFCVGFAAETHDLEARTIAKCARKGCDLIVGNDVSKGVFGSSHNTVIIADRDAVLSACGPAPKLAVAAEVWSVILSRYGSS